MKKRVRSYVFIRANRGRIVTYKKEALHIASSRVAHFARIYGVKYAKISIRAQKRRWGSCSRAGNLSFNYKIALLPPKIADYIIVHEICHLREFNHSKAFWELVAKAIPQHRVIRKKLHSLAFVFT